MLGQLVVVLPPGRRDLDFGRYWEVEPLGVIEGTNGFGTPIQVPEVRFWRYWESNCWRRWTAGFKEGLEPQVRDPQPTPVPGRRRRTDHWIYDCDRSYSGIRIPHENRKQKT